MGAFGKLAVGLGLLLASPLTAQQTPVAAKKSHAVTSPYGTREDEYYWLRDDTRQDPQMLAYLKAENAYADTVLAPLAPLKARLYAEAVARIAPDDRSVPYRRNGYWYYTRYTGGSAYPVVARREGSMAAPEQLLLDQPALAAGEAHFDVGEWAVSPDNRLLAWTEDKVGRLQFALRIKDLATGQMLADSVTNIEPDLVWAADNKTLLYVEKDPVTLLGSRVKAHVLGTPASADRLIHDEKDTSFYIGLRRTSSDRYLCIDLWGTVSDEARCAPADAPDRLSVIAPREREFHYTADHLDGRWTIRTNWQAPNYRLMTVAEGDVARGRAAWRDLVPARDTAFVESFALLHGVTAIEERAEGNKRVRLLAADGASRIVDADAPAYAMSLVDNHDPENRSVRYTYDTLVTPTATYEVEAATGERRLLKTVPAPGYDPADYVTERAWATARDGTKVPVSLAYRKGFRRDGTGAMLQIGYGAYGSSYDPEFRAAFPSLMDRGMVIAIAHIRGGQEMGRKWYDDGHLLAKRNSFTDFIDVTRWLVAQHYAAPGRVAASGRSAGGLLMGAVANMAPQDYALIDTAVPFVDAVTTMLDASIPLTSNEYDEWGNPAEKRYYDYLLGYSPYDNIAAKPYPAIYVSTGLWDSQVQYYEPAKWVARLRARKTDANPLLFRIDMTSGHAGTSGRFGRIRDDAEWHAFMLDRLGVAP